MCDIKKAHAFQNMTVGKQKNKKTGTLLLGLNALILYYLYYTFYSAQFMTCLGHKMYSLSLMSGLIVVDFKYDLLDLGVVHMNFLPFEMAIFINDWL